MSITLSDGSSTITLHPDLYWPDENSYSPVAQSVERTITGALIVSVESAVTGRPITLQPEDDSSAWMTRSTLDALRAWAAVAGKTMTLNLRGTSLAVMFRHQDAPAVDARPVTHFSDVESTDFYLVTLKFMEI